MAPLIGPLINFRAADIRNFVDDPVGYLGIAPLINLRPADIRNIVNDPL
jgi:hypothetical protein